MDLNEIRRHLEDGVNPFGYEIYSITTKKELGSLILEVIVDRDKPIDMNDIEEISAKINEIIDEIDPINEDYMLSVMSLGAEKPLKIEKLKDYIGSYINLHLISPIEGENIYEGTIISVNDEEIELSYKIKTRTKSIKTKLSNIYKVRLAIKF